MRTLCQNLLHLLHKDVLVSAFDLLFAEVSINNFSVHAKGAPNRNKPLLLMVPFSVNTECYSHTNDASIKYSASKSTHFRLIIAISFTQRAKPKRAGDLCYSQSDPVPMTFFVKSRNKIVGDRITFAGIKLWEIRVDKKKKKGRGIKTTKADRRRLLKLYDTLQPNKFSVFSKTVRECLFVRSDTRSNDSLELSHIRVGKTVLNKGVSHSNRSLTGSGAVKIKPGSSKKVTDEIAHRCFLKLNKIDRKIIAHGNNWR